MKLHKILIAFFVILSSCIPPDEDETRACEPIFFVNQSDSDVYCIFYYGNELVEKGACYSQTMLKVDKPIPLEKTVDIYVYNLAEYEEYQQGNISRPPRIGELELTVSMLRKQDMIVKYPFAEQPL